MSSNSTDLVPRLCVLEKGSDGYGFHLHGEKGKIGQFIRLVEEGSPAECSGLRAGDRLVEVNGENVESESHQQVVGRIREVQPPGRVRLLVVDRETDQLLSRLGLKCREEYIRGIPDAGGQSDQPRPQEQESERRESSSSTSTDTPGTEGTENKVNGEELVHEKLKNGGEKDNKMTPKEHRPRLCQMKKGAGGYGFNLHSDKSKPGQYIRAVDPDSPAEKAGLLPQDRIIEVNEICMEGRQHSDVVTAIKSGGDETQLLVVDPETDEFFKKCGVIPTQDHINGPLPEVIANGELEEKVNTVSAKEGETVSIKKYIPEAQLSANPEPSVALSEKSKEENSDSRSSEDLAIDFNLSLAAAKERAHQKRSSKRAPQMDWSKKNELFSNL